MSETPRIHYFDAPEKAEDDVFLKMCKTQGYVPAGCLLLGNLVWAVVNEGKDPCKGCAGDRAVCGGRQP